MSYIIAMLFKLLKSLFTKMAAIAAIQYPVSGSEMAIREYRYRLALEYRNLMEKVRHHAWLRFLLRPALLRLINLETVADITELLTTNNKGGALNTASVTSSIAGSRINARELAARATSTLVTTMVLFLFLAAAAALCFGSPETAVLTASIGALATKMAGKEDLLAEWIVARDAHMAKKRMKSFYAKLRRMRGEAVSVLGMRMTIKVDRKGKNKGYCMHLTGTVHGRMIEAVLSWDLFGVFQPELFVHSPQIITDGEKLLKANGAIASWATRFISKEMLHNFKSFEDLGDAELTDDGKRWAAVMLRILDRRLVYRNYSRDEVEVLTYDDLEQMDADTAAQALDNLVYEDEEYKWFITTLNAQKPHRPILEVLRNEGIDIEMVTFSKSVVHHKQVEDITRGVGEFYEERRGRVCVAPIKNTWFFVPADQVDRLFELINVDPRMAANWVRLGAITKRTGSVAVDMELPAGVLPDETDGTIAVDDRLPFGQGTFSMKHNGTLYFVKGVTRPQGRVLINGEWRKETSGRSPVAEFKHKLPQGSGKFVFNNVFSKENAITSLQLHAFTQKNLVKWLLAETRKMIDRPAHTLASERVAGFVEAGVPAALVMRGHDNPFELAYRFERPAARCRIVGLGKDEEGSWIVPDHMKEWVFMTRDVIEDIEAQLERRLTPGDKVDLTQVLSRDPANVDASGAVVVIFGGEVAFPAQESVIAMRADSEAWLLMAGDFDGDSALYWVRESHDELRTVEHPELLREAKAAIRLDGGKSARGLGGEIDHVETAVMLSMTRASEIGKPVLRGMRLAFEGRLDEEVVLEEYETIPEALQGVFEKGLPFTYRTLLAIQVQGYIDDAKHPVDGHILGWLNAVTLRAVDYEAENLFVDLDKFKGFSSADHAAVVAAWKKLAVKAKAVAEAGTAPREQLALANYLLALDAKYEELGLLHKAADEVPEELRQAGKLIFRAHLKNTTTMEQRSVLRKKTKVLIDFVNNTYRSAAKAYAIAAEKEDERAMEAAGDAMEYARELARSVVRSGKIHPMNALAEFHKRLVFEAIEPYHAQAAAEMLKTGAVVLNATGELMVGHTYDVAKLILGKTLYQDQVRKLRTLGHKVKVLEVENHGTYYATTFAPAK